MYAHVYILSRHVGKVYALACCNIIAKSLRLVVANVKLSVTLAPGLKAQVDRALG